MSISVALAVYNEEENIKKCIDAVYDFADEIIVVDGKSIDKTISILKEIDKNRKIKIYSENNPVMFHINKQKALDKCSKDWILQLDADEIIDEKLQKEIKEIIKKTEFNGYWIPRLNYFLGNPLTKGGQYPDYTLRLYKNKKAHLPCKDVHEQAVVEGHIGYLKNPIKHYPYKNFGSYIDKWNRYNIKEAIKLKSENFKPNLLNGFDYLVIKPIFWFFLTYFRHLGLIDGFSGFVFSFMSSIRFIGIYLQLLYR